MLERPATGGTRAALVVFALALALRLLYWQATPDRDWAYSVAFKGDAPVWLECARALQQGLPYDSGLPIHPPGAGYLVALLWNGLPTGLAFLRFAWALMGALLVLVFYRAVARSFSPWVAAAAAGWAAASSGLIVLSNSVNNETPYLLLAMGSLLLVDGRELPASRLRLAGWSALHALATLVRVEHLLFYLLMLGLLAQRGRSQPRRTIPALAGSAAMFVLLLVPWQVAAWTRVARFNREVPTGGSDEASLGAVERSLAHLAWEPAAAAARDRLPGFVRRQGSLFVAATVAHRGGTAVRGDDFRILDDAFGYQPRPVPPFPFVSLYGPLNFALANHPGASGGFSRRPLAEPPPLRPSADRFPPSLVAGLPPAELTLVYPPHLRLFNDGYAIGTGFIAEDPSRFARLVARKLAIFWTGATSGFTGYDLPRGAAGLRRSVDMLAPEGWPARSFGLLVLGGCLVGLALAWRQPALGGWLLWLASKLVVTVLFFGYVRQGALVVPVVALLCALGLERLAKARPAVGTLRALLTLAVFCLLLEAARFARPGELWIDGRRVTGRDPLPTWEHGDQRIEVR